MQSVTGQFFTMHAKVDFSLWVEFNKGENNGEFPSTTQI